MAAVTAVGAQAEAGSGAAGEAGGKVVARSGRRVGTRAGSIENEIQYPSGTGALL